LATVRLEHRVPEFPTEGATDYLLAISGKGSEREDKTAMWSDHAVQPGCAI